MKDAVKMLQELHTKIEKEEWADQKRKQIVLFGINLCITKLENTMQMIEEQI